MGLKVGDVMESRQSGQVEGWRRPIRRKNKVGSEGWRRNGKNKVWFLKVGDVMESPKVWF